MYAWAKEYFFPHCLILDPDLWDLHQSLTLRKHNFLEKVSLEDIVIFKLPFRNALE